MSAGSRITFGQLGRLLMSAGIKASGLSLAEIVDCVQRHWHCDWGELADEDRQANERALKEGLRLLSAYQTHAGKVWVITEADRSATTVLFPHEY